ncbi:MAG: hypothetical protein EBX66_07480, partial [Betaproteobacteria bacterium]|nr:hypothetical protein [Betaproteobacteria bacterium]
MRDVLSKSASITTLKPTGQSKLDAAERRSGIRGRVQGHRDGFGFLIPDDG